MPTIKLNISICGNDQDFRHLKLLSQYIGYALNMKFTQQEICEVIAQSGWYRGWPHVEDALEEAKAVFEIRGLEV